LKETLYQKKNGEWFLLGEGGAMTRYCINSGDSRCGGSNIIPLTENEAKKWVEIHHNDDYEQLFGEVEE
ncbi:MAG: hypothetical protein J5672_02105, partial [Verrucomicrobia bacterium]|nr:hypothetical protein [Verrucomicrobiota bacterium]